MLYIFSLSSHINKIHIRLAIGKSANLAKTSYKLTKLA